VAFFDKLKFWKREESLAKDLGFGKDPGFDKGKESLGIGDFGNYPFGKEAGLSKEFGGKGFGEHDISGSALGGEERHPFYSKEDTDVSIKGEGFNPKEYEEPSLRPVQLRQQSSHDVMLSKDMEIVSAKLDAIRSMLESMSQRLIMLERQGNDKYRRGGNW